jgi:hypothetical protein
MPSERRAIGQAKPVATSRITNGRELLANVDGRSLLARRYRDIIAVVIADQGGTDGMTEARRQLIRRFASLAVQAGALDARVGNGEEIDLGEYSTLTSTMVRVAHRIGLNRVAKNITSLGEILSAGLRERESA